MGDVSGRGEGKKRADAIVKGDYLYPRSEREPQGNVRLQRVEEVFVRVTVVLGVRVADRQEPAAYADLSGRGTEPPGRVGAVHQRHDSSKPKNRPRWLRAASCQQPWRVGTHCCKYSVPQA